MFTKKVMLDPFIQLWDSLILALPRLLAAIIVFVIGWLIAKLVYKAILKLAHSIKIDEPLKPMSGAIERAGYKLEIGKVFGFLVKWFIVIGSFTIALDFLGLQQTKSLLVDIVAYIPAVIVAIIVMIVGIIVADFVKKMIQGSTKMLNVKSATILANLAKTTIVVFATLLALSTIGIGAEIISILFIGVVAMLALAGGLAFGLGGRDAAAQAIKDIKESMQK
jgi:hypothetical protein